MDYPKYLEFANLGVVIFPSAWSHRSTAEKVGLLPVSAGMFSASRTRNGKFFGCSTSLDLSANKGLSLAEGNLWSGLTADMPALPVVASSTALLEKLEVPKILLASHIEVEGIFVPEAHGRTAEELLGWFLP